MDVQYGVHRMVGLSSGWLSCSGFLGGCESVFFTICSGKPLVVKTSSTYVLHLRWSTGVAADLESSVLHSSHQTAEDSRVVVRVERNVLISMRGLASTTSYWHLRFGSS